MPACDALMSSTAMTTILFLDTKMLVNALHCFIACYESHYFHGNFFGRQCVDNVGDGVEHLKVGNTAMVLYLGECGECLNWRLGKTNLSHFNGPFDCCPCPFSVEENVHSLD